MAHNAETSYLVERLIKASINNPSEADVERCKRSALRTLTNSQSSRINQFEVAARLEGLEEKWRILNNDALAEALHHRRAELSGTSNGWIPEILSLFLRLSDRPADRSNFEHLALLKPKVKLPSAPLTWAEIVAEDPLDNRNEIWKNVDFRAADSDDDDFSESFLSDRSVSTQESSVIGREPETCAEILIEPATTISLREIQSARSWKTEDADEFDLIGEEDKKQMP